jgi:MFS transporter, DHA2 family, multidrug resistance protein
VQSGPVTSVRERLALIAIALPCVAYSMDLAVLNLAVPAISASMSPTASELLWIVDIYSFLLAGSLLTMGMLGDRIGRRRLLMFGAAGFCAASLLAAFATSPSMLIAARALLGVAAATMAPSALYLIRHMFEQPSARTMAISVWVMSCAAGSALGPVVGGVLLERFWWGSVFLINVPSMLVLLVLAPELLPEHRQRCAGRADILGAVQSLAAVLALVYGLKRFTEQGGDWGVAAAVWAGFALGAAFVRRQMRLHAPLIDLRLLRVPGLSAALGVNALGFATSLATLVFAAQYMQSVLGLSPLQAGMWQVPSALSFLVGAIIAPSVARWAPPSRIVAAGLMVAACGFALMAQVDSSASSLALLVSGSVLLSLGLTPVGIVITDLILDIVPRERAGVAGALSETAYELGGALGIAVMGSVIMATYRSELIASLSGPAAAILATSHTIDAALAISATLPPDLAAGVMDGARHSFALAFARMATIGASLAVVLAPIAWLTLRRMRLLER